MSSRWTWVESIPSDTSKVVLGPRNAHTTWQTISGWLSRSLYWDGDGGSSTSSRGEPRPGSQRMYVGPQSQFSNTGGSGDTVGKVMLTVGMSGNTVTSPEIRCWPLSSFNQGDVVFGTASLIEHAEEPALGFAWNIQSGSYTTDTSTGSQKITVGHYYASDNDDIVDSPFVHATSGDNNVFLQIWPLSGASKSEVIIEHFTEGASPGSTYTIYWLSIGTELVP